MDSYKHVSLWLRVVSYLLIALAGIGEYISILEESNDHTKAFGGATAAFLIFGMISLACGRKCAQWASKINKSPNWAYFFGFFLWFVGFIGYWAYYKKRAYKEELRQTQIKGKMRKLK